MVIEAAHPLDSDTAFEAQTAARAAGLPHLQLLRRQWRPGRGYLWVSLRRVGQARQVVTPGARLLVTTGRGFLPELRGIRATVLMRRIGAASGPFPLPRGRWLPGEGPFSIAEEIALLRKERIDWLLLRNAGGQGSWPKLAAARRLGLSVAMVARPDRPDGPRATDIQEAMAWIAAQRRS